MIHIVDLDGAKMGKPNIIKIVKQIVKEVRIQIQVGGGIRTFTSMYRYIEAGIERIIISTLALENKKLLKKFINSFGKKIVVSLDVKNNKLMKKGWLQPSNLDLIQAIKQIEEIGIKTIIYTDIIRDGTLTEPNYEEINLIRKNTKMNLIVAGGISSFEQIKKLKKMKVDAVIIGKALYEEKINLKEVIKYVS